jgi:hypothetical protein
LAFGALIEGFEANALFFSTLICVAASLAFLSVRIEPSPNP